MFILWKQKQNVDLTTKNLELEIENWIRAKTNTNITFNSDQSIEFLRKIGNLSFLQLKQIINDLLFRYSFT
jgi:hypothetical protein